MSHTIKLDVSNLTGQSQIYEINPQTKIHDFINQVLITHQAFQSKLSSPSLSPINSIPNNNSSLIYNGKTLDSSKTFSQYKEFQMIDKLVSNRGEIQTIDLNKDECISPIKCDSHIYKMHILTKPMTHCDEFELIVNNNSLTDVDFKTLIEVDSFSHDLTYRTPLSIYQYNAPLEISPLQNQINRLEQRHKKETTIDKNIDNADMFKIMDMLSVINIKLDILINQNKSKLTDDDLSKTATSD